MTIDDHAEPRVRCLQARDDRARLAACRQPHGVEEVREPGEALRQRGLGLRIGCRGARARRGRRPWRVRDEPVRNLLGSERDERHARSPSRQLLCIVRRGPSERRGIVHARLLGRQERSFQVDAENARIGGNDRCAASSAARILAGVSLIRVGRCRRSEVPMRPDDGRNPIRRWTVVEQDIAAAVHLDVDEAGREPGASRQNTVGTAEGSSDLWRSAAMHDPSITTAQSGCSLEPSKTLSAITASV